MIKNLRWYIAGLLMLATTVNYLDRQVLAIAQSELSAKFGFSNLDYSRISLAFLFAYGSMMPIAGRVIDWLGTRWGFALSVFWWSVANMAHAFAGSVFSFAGFRFLLGIGEAGNFPGSVKTVSQWFPPQERATATGIFNLGAGTGAVIAPPLVGWIIIQWGWQAAFIATGAVGFIWIILWLLMYHDVENHPRLSPEELNHIQRGSENDEKGVAQRGAWREVLSRKEIWPLMAGRALSDPVWWFYLIWLPPYLNQARGFQLKDIAMFAWVPYLAADIGSILGGTLSTFLIKRGFSVLNSRKISMLMCASLMPISIPAALASQWEVALICISIATFGHQSWSASFITLPADIFPKRVVASAYGLAGMCGVLGSGLFTWGVGIWVDTVGYKPMFVIVGFMHLLATAVVALFIHSRFPLGTISTESTDARAAK